jgi:hypothetical protein
MSLKYGVTSNIETGLIIIEADSLLDAVTKYLTDWYPGADEIRALPVLGEGWKDK